MSNRFNNPDVCLVRNDAGDIIVFQAGGFQSSVGSGGHGCDRLLIRLFAQHLNGIELLVDVSGSNRATAPAARHEEDIGKLSIAPHVCRDYAVRICAIPQNRCASPVAEKHAGVSIGSVATLELRRSLAIASAKLDRHRAEQTKNEAMEETALRRRRASVRLAFADHMDRFVAGDRVPSSPE